MTQVVALTALTALGLSRAPVHEPVHADGRGLPMTITERSGQNPSQRHLNLTTPTTHSETFAWPARRVGTPEKGETCVVVLIPSDD
jgi:hypothetical protein